MHKKRQNDGEPPTNQLVNDILQFKKNNNKSKVKLKYIVYENLVPYEAFKTKNGYLTVGTGSDSQFQALCGYLNIPHIPNDPKFINNEQRVKHRAELISILTDIFAKETSQHWMSIFENAPFPAGPINSIADVFDDPHIKEIGLVKTLSHPTGGEIKVVGPPVTYSESSNTARSAPPLLGQHTDEILRDILEYDDSKIKDLRARNIIQ